MKTPNKTLVLRPILYHISLAGHQFFTCDEMSLLKLDYLLSKHQSLSWKLSLNLCFMGLNQHYTGSAGRSARENALNKILSQNT